MIGFFGGSFDPLHFGHIALCVDLVEAEGLEKVIFCPVYCSPFKKENPPFASPEQRLEMLRLGLEGIPWAEVSDLEIQRKGVSYTIDTLRALEGKKKGALRLILSAETKKTFDLWKEASAIREIAPPLVGERSEISSTEVRSRIKKKLYCGHLVPAKVLDYIHRHRLYSS